MRREPRSATSVELRPNEQALRLLSKPVTPSKPSHPQIDMAIVDLSGQCMRKHGFQVRKVFTLPPLLCMSRSHSCRIASCTSRPCHALRTTSLQASVITYTETNSTCRDSNKSVATVRPSISHCTSRGFPVRHRGARNAKVLTCQLHLHVDRPNRLDHFLPSLILAFAPTGVVHAPLLPLITTCGSLFHTHLQDADISLGHAPRVRGKRGYLFFRRHVFRHRGSWHTFSVHPAADERCFDDA